MKITNSYDGTLLKQGETLITRKEDAKNHGIGLKNVNEIIMKYNGNKEIETTDNRFTIKLVLYINETVALTS